MSGEPASKSLAWARLLRVPNLFTAQADVYVGLVASGALLQQPLAATALIVSSTALYAGGIALNDVVDVAEDRRERPSRPLPSGAISVTRAAAAAFGLLAGGVAFAMSAAALSRRSEPLVVAISLAAAILAYDLGGKRTAAGPLILGVCRFLNVLLGWTLTTIVAMNAKTLPTLANPLLTASVMATFVWALSTLAKHETTGLPLSAARRRMSLIFIPLGLMVALAARQDWREFQPLDWIAAAMCAALNFACAVVMSRVWRASAARDIGRAVGGLLSLIILIDGTMLAIMGHGAAGLAVLALYVPVLTLRRQIYMT
ncbi:MAG: UbiA family prenyltransferase [Phycisphaerales bacterium]|nr:UbiA family prenyltransferase [Phycisphaerales bacterium]